jgi:hypothetical protein
LIINNEGAVAKATAPSLNEKTNITILLKNNNPSFTIK